MMILPQRTLLTGAHNSQENAYVNTHAHTHAHARTKGGRIHYFTIQFVPESNLEPKFDGIRKPNLEIRNLIRSRNQIRTKFGQIWSEFG